MAKRVGLEPSEHQIQVAFIEWTEIQSLRNPDYELWYAHPNGGLRHISVARKLKREGVKSGVPDLFWANPVNGWHGFYLEMKKQGGALKDSQKWWLLRLAEKQYCVAVCYGLDEAIDATLKYEEGKAEWENI